jgi:integrase
VATFLAASERVTARFATFFLLLARTGLRLGEGPALQWADVDFDARSMRIARTFSNDRLEGSPKGNRGRVIDMSQQLTRALRRLEIMRKTQTLRRGWVEVPPWVFCDDEGQPLKEQTVERAFTRVLKAAGRPGHFSPHSLRHTYASMLLSDGASPVYVQRQLGHASIRLTVDLYGRWLPMEDKGAVDRLDDEGGGSR